MVESESDFQEEDVTGKKKTRSGRVYVIKPEHYPPSMRKSVSIFKIRMFCIPKIPNAFSLPNGPCLKYKYENRTFRYPERDPIWKTGSYEYDNQLTEKTLERISNFKDRMATSAFQSGKKCVLEYIVKRGDRPNRVKFGNVTVIHY